MIEANVKLFFSKTLAKMSAEALSSIGPDKKIDHFFKFENGAWLDSSSNSDFKFINNHTGDYRKNKQCLKRAIIGTVLIEKYRDSKDVCSNDRVTKYRKTINGMWKLLSITPTYRNLNI